MKETYGLVLKDIWLGSDFLIKKKKTTYFFQTPKQSYKYVVHVDLSKQSIYWKYLLLTHGPNMKLRHVGFVVSRWKILSIFLFFALEIVRMILLTRLVCIPF